MCSQAAARASVAGVAFPILANGSDDAANNLMRTVTFMSKGLGGHIFSRNLPGYEAISVSPRGAGLLVGIGATGSGLRGAPIMQLAPFESPSLAPADAGGSANQAMTPVFAVSNLKSTLKNVKRRKGAVLTERVATTSDGTFDTALVAGPGGQQVQLIHRFVRSPLLAVAVEATNPEEMADWYFGHLGMSRVAADDDTYGWVGEAGAVAVQDGSGGGKGAVLYAAKVLAWLIHMVCWVCLSDSVQAT